VNRCTVATLKRLSGRSLCLLPTAGVASCTWAEASARDRADL